VSFSIPGIRGSRVAVHEAIGKSNDLVFRCTLRGSDAGRWVEIPAWMFDQLPVRRHGLLPPPLSVRRRCRHCVISCGRR
jgi:hypothetical protein